MEGRRQRDNELTHSVIDEYTKPPMPTAVGWSPSEMQLPTVCWSFLLVDGKTTGALDDPGARTGALDDPGAMTGALDTGALDGAGLVGAGVLPSADGVNVCPLMTGDDVTPWPLGALTRVG